MPVSVVTDANGNFTAMITAPTSLAGVYNITATDEYDDTASALFTVPDMTGPKGDTGAAGVGPQGATGSAGSTGATGQPGEKGDKGDTGETGPTGSPAPEVINETMLPLTSIVLAIVALVASLLAALLAVQLKRRR